MTLHVCVLGIDGSGKSTITLALPSVLASELKLKAGSAGEIFRMSSPDEDSLEANYHPEGLPLAARLSMHFRTAAKRFVNNRKIYPVFKLSQMVFKDSAARLLGRRFDADVIVSDGNALISAMGRAANYLNPATDRIIDITEDAEHDAEAEDLKSALSYILEDEPLSQTSKDRLPRNLWIAKLICRVNDLLGIGGVWLPDVVVFLDVSPETAMEHIAKRGCKIDCHENRADLAQAREMYLKSLAALRLYRPQTAVHCIDANEKAPGEVLSEIVEILKPLVGGGKRLGEPDAEKTLGASGLKNGSALWKKVFNFRYIFSYLFAKWFEGAWREPLFILSETGRLFLNEGYSANLMKAIYDQDANNYGATDQIFLNHPLHRAVYDRLKILSNRIEAELEERLSRGERVSIFTAPSGYAYDVFLPLESIATRTPEKMKLVRLIAADLDPQNRLAEELSRRAEALGIEFEFHRGDISDEEMRMKFRLSGPYDMALFVGLSSWLPKPKTLCHLELIRDVLREDGMLFSDCFTADAYSISGRYAGFKANYYAPEVYRAMLDYCGFDWLGAEVESGRDQINHVVTTRPINFSPQRTRRSQSAMKISL